MIVAFVENDGELRLCLEGVAEEDGTIKYETNQGVYSDRFKDGDTLDGFIGVYGWVLQEENNINPRFSSQFKISPLDETPETQHHHKIPHKF